MRISVSVLPLPVVKCWVRAIDCIGFFVQIIFLDSYPLDKRTLFTRHIFLFFIGKADSTFLKFRTLFLVAYPPPLLLFFRKSIITPRYASNYSHAYNSWFNSLYPVHNVKYHRHRGTATFISKSSYHYSTLIETWSGFVVTIWAVVTPVVWARRGRVGECMFANRETPDLEPR